VAKTVSQAGRVIICNQVLLATCWYMAAYCGISAKNCDIIKGLIVQYMWMGRDERRCAARVKWAACI